MAETGLTNQASKPKVPTLLPLVKGSDKKFKLVIKEELLDKIKYLCREFPTQEWSGVLFYEALGDVSDLDTMILTAFDLYPLDLGSAVYTEFSHSPDFAGYVARHPDLMDAHMGLIHSHNNMATFFSGTDTATLQEMSPIYENYLSLIVNNKGDYTAAIGVNATMSSVINYKGLDYSDKDYTGADREVVLRFDATIHKETTNYDNQEFIDSVEELKKNTTKQSYKTRVPSIPTVYQGGALVSGESHQLELFKGTSPRETSFVVPSATGKETEQMVEFVCKLASQNYFYEVNNTKSFEGNLLDALSKVPKDMHTQKYSMMVYEFIEPLLTYMEIILEEEQASLLIEVINKLDPLKAKTEYYNEIYESIHSFFTQITEDYDVASEELEEVISE